jgi:hypothetical protein
MSTIVTGQLLAAVSDWPSPKRMGLAASAHGLVDIFRWLPIMRTLGSI